MRRKIKVEELCQCSARSNGLANYRESRVPQVRLKGKWLQAAGLAPGQHIQITVCSPGVIELRLIEAPEARAARLGAEFLATAQRLDAAIAANPL